jgi:hypothetical protein
VDFITDPCGLAEDAESAVSSPVSSLSDIPESPLPCTPPADRENARFQYDIHAENLPRGEEAAVEGLLDLSSLGPSPGAADCSGWHPPQTGDSEPPSHPDKVFPSVRSEISKSSLNRSNGVPFSFHSPASQISASGGCLNVQLSGREAILLRNYIDNVSPWV